MEDREYIVVFVTCQDGKQAKQIASVLLDRREAACVNIISGIRSFFRWQSKVESSDEVLLLVKTQASLFESVRKTVKEIHSYQIPEIIALPVVEGDGDYLHWIQTETQH